MDHTIADAFAKNRAELFPLDVWGIFVVPPFFEQSTVLRDTKAIKIEGGRGCGKTILMRYLCHETTLSTKRGLLTTDDLAFIGLYWKPDIRFCRLLTSAWLGERADIAFSTYVALMVIEQFGLSLNSLANANVAGGKLDLRGLAIPDTLRPYFDEKTNTYGDLITFAASKSVELDLWVQNPSQQAPKFFQFPGVLEQLVERMATADPRIADTFYRVFVDEYENLQPSQQIVVNDYIKQPRRRHCVSFAVRRHAISSFLTSTLEQLIEPHDYRSINIEYELMRDPEGFKLLAAEIMLLTLRKGGIGTDLACFDPAKLFDTKYLQERANKTYRQEVLSIVRAMLPKQSAREIAGLAMEDSAMRRRVLMTLRKGLDRKGAKDLDADAFIVDQCPEATVVAASVVHRANVTPDAILAEIDDLKATDGRGSPTNLFTKDGGWIQNTLHGALFYIYIGLPRRECLLYAGFDRFCGLSMPNLRYFQELCHQAFLNVERSDSNPPNSDAMVVSLETQAEAARSVSEKLLAQVEQCGPHGKGLHDMVMRLGHLFEAAHRRPSQSEPEINHFSIDEAGRVALKSEASERIEQAIMWSVLYEAKDTKNKSDYDLMQRDLIPNPIYSPYFGISYRKRRKLSLDAAEVNIIVTGSGEAFQKLLKDKSQSWDLDDPDTEVSMPGSLF